MAKAHIRGGALTISLTPEMREKLDIRDGDELAAHIFEGSLTLTRTAAKARKAAGKRILALIDQVRLRSGQPDMAGDEIERMIDREVKSLRRRRRRPA